MLSRVEFGFRSADLGKLDLDRGPLGFNHVSSGKGASNNRLNDEAASAGVEVCELCVLRQEKEIHTCQHAGLIKMFTLRAVCGSNLLQSGL